MASFGDVLREIQDEQLNRNRDGFSDPIRRRYLNSLYALTGRNVIVYYSGFLQRPGPEHSHTTKINDEDKHGFMATTSGLDFNQGLDLILHTPGGDIAATESIIEYLRSKFKDGIRVFVPQISMSGGTMIALAGKQIFMGHHSNLGPIDPQLGGRSAIAILEEFETARKDIVADPKQALLWQPILQHYEPTTLSHAQQSIKWSREIGEKTLKDGMLSGQPDADEKAKTIVEFLLSRDLHKAHGRHLHRDELRNQGLDIMNLEDDPDLQDAVLSVHHACMLTVGNFNVNKLIENHKGVAHVKLPAQVQIPVPIQLQQPTPAQPTPAQPTPAQNPVPIVPSAPPKIPFKTRLQLALKLLFGRSSIKP